MPDTQKAWLELREAERHLLRALQLIGMARGKQGYVAPAVAEALQNLRGALQNIDVPAVPVRRSWPRLARRR